MDMGERWAEYDGLRGRVPSWHPVGVVVEADGPVVRRHYGTHGTVEHAPSRPGPTSPGWCAASRRLSRSVAGWWSGRFTGTMRRTWARR